MAKNPFDQFDAPKGNPFDQFETDELIEETRKRETETGIQGINAARVVGTGAVKGMTEAMGVPAMILGIGGPSPKIVIDAADWLRRQVGASPISPEGKADYTRTAESMRLDPQKGLKSGLEAVGLPTEPAEEAKRLKVPYNDKTLVGEGVAGLAQAARYGTSAALTGMGPVPSALSAVGAGAGQVLGDEIGAAIGAGVAPLAGLVRGSPIKAPALDTVRMQKDVAYATSEKAGVVVLGDAVKKLADDVKATVAGRIGTSDLHPQANAAIKYIEQQAKAGDVTLKGLDLMRQTVKNTLYMANGRPRTDVSAGDAALVGKIVDELDAFESSLRLGANVIAGDAALGVTAMHQARALNTKLKKGEVIQKVIDDADTYSSSFDISVRNGFGKLARSKQYNLFNPQEQKAIDKMVEGGSSLAQGFKFLGKMAPTRSALFATLETLGVIGGHYMNNHHALSAAVTLAVATELAKRASLGIARKNAREVVGLMTMGYKPPNDIDIRALGPAIIQGYQRITGEKEQQ